MSAGWRGLAALCAVLGLLPAAAAQDAFRQDRPVALEAESLTYDRNLDTLTARGDVVLAQDGTTVRADTISYQRSKDLVTASGNVTLWEPDGNVVHAAYMELSGSLRDGFMREARLRLADATRMAAAEITREDGARNRLERVVYSPCDLCAGETDPLWQLKAKSVTHDEEALDITYRDAWLEFAGTPVLYTPYLSHADPRAGRRSGFLTPSLGGTEDLGVKITTPYHITFTPSHDMTVLPTVTGKEGVVLGAEHRLWFGDGLSTMAGSFTRDSQDTWRSHLVGDVSMDLSRIWRVRSHVDLTSDDTYRRRYGYGSEPFLTTRAFLEGFSGLSRASAGGMLFQELRADVDDDTSPLVLPMLDYRLVGATGRYGYPTLAFSGVALHRNQGTSSRRGSLEGVWTLPHVGEGGDITTLTASLRGDLYHVEDGVRDDGRAFDGFTGRLQPVLGATWRYPLIRREQGGYQVIEPVIAAYWSPVGNNPDTIPNEDSRDLEFDDTNLLASDRFVGYDRVETGPRLSYGATWALYDDSGRQAHVFLGQALRLHDDAIFPEESGLSGRLSDIVGRVYAAPRDGLDVVYRFQVDRRSLEWRRSELSVDTGSDALRLGVTYMFINATSDAFGAFGDREEVGVSLRSRLSKHWYARAFHQHNLATNGGPVAIEGGLAYEDECMALGLDVGRRFTSDRDFEGGLSAVITLTLKTLGTLQTGGDTQ